MSKSIVLKRNDNDDAKLQQMQSLQPKALLQYEYSSALGNAKLDLGNVDYVLATGGHGNFINRKPTKFNGADMDNFKKWIGNLKGTAKAFILDTCFSSALCPVFIKFVPVGGAVVCAHGSGEGWAGSFNTGNGTRTVGAILSGIIDSAVSLFGADSGATSISLLLNKPHGKTLFTVNSGTARRSTLDKKKSFFMDTDEEIELKELDLYLRREGVMVTPVETDKLKTLLTENLKMTIM